MQIRQLTYGLAGTLALSLGALSPAQAEFPEKEITVIVGYGAGGGTDTMIRKIAETVSEDLGQPILVQNKPGAGGGVAAAFVAGAPADGYTLVATTSTTYTLDPQLVEAPYEDNDFQHVAVIGQFQEAFLAKADAPFDTIKEAIQQAKEDDRSLQYASFYQLDKLVTDYIAQKEGVEITPVPVKGGAGVLPAVLGGHVDFGWSGGTYGPHVASGEVKLIGAATVDRLALYPEVPSMGDLGYVGGSEVFLIISAPDGTPDEAVQTLAAAFEKGTKDPEYQDLLVDKRNMKEVFLGPKETTQALEKQKAMYSELVEATTQ